MKGVNSPTAHRGIWHSAGATRSWCSLVSFSCSWRISLCIRLNYDSGGWATRIIHFNLLVFSTVSISLAIRNHLFRLEIEGTLTFRDISSVVIRRKCMHLLHRLCTKFTHPWNGKRLLFLKGRRSLYLTAANTEGIRRWLWQVSISFN